MPAVPEQESAEDGERQEETGARRRDPDVQRVYGRRPVRVRSRDRPAAVGRRTGRSEDGRSQRPRVSLHVVETLLRPRRRHHQSDF